MSTHPLPQARHSYALALVAAALLVLGAFVPLWWVQLCCLPALALLFEVLRTVPARYAHRTGLVFCLAWLLPTTYWYYSFMSPLLAVAASVGYSLLLANLFRLAGLRSRWGMRVVAPLFTGAWCALLWLRLHLPVTEDWWIPYAGYSLWRNPCLVFVGGFGGEAVFEAVILATGALTTWAWARLGWRGAAVTGAVLLAAVGVGNAALWSVPASSAGPALAVQRMTRGGVDVPATDDDVTDLMAVTDQALGAAPSTPGEVRTVVWPENTVPAASEARIAAYAAQRRVRLVYHTKVGQGEQAHKYSVIIGADGRRVMASSKAHIAPDEQGTGEMSRHQATDAGRVVTSYVCYDMHYPDIVGRLRGADAAYASLDDATYGYLQKQFHTADIALHAAQAGVPVVVASSNGPTFAVDAHGVVRGQLTGSGPAVLVVR